MTSEPGLRERKKRATRRALQLAALRLVAERGLDDVTVEQIAAAAGVSPRTFFNYFTTKEDALSSLDPDAVDEACRAILARPAGEPPYAAVRAVLRERAERVAADAEFWRLRSQVVSAYPELSVRIVGASVRADRRMTLALAERMGVDPGLDLRPGLVVGAATTARRVAIHTWLAEGQQRDLLEVVDEAFVTLRQLVTEA